MEWTAYLFEKAEDPDTLQMACRGACVFICALIILRAGGRRTFGKGTATDNVVVIMLGGILSRVVTGAASFVPVMAATVTIILLHRGIAWLGMQKGLTAFITGKRKLLFKDGQYFKQNMRRTLSSTEDLKEAMRLKLNTDDLKKVDEINMERNGEISVTELK